MQNNINLDENYKRLTNNFSFLGYLGKGNALAL